MFNQKINILQIVDVNGNRASEGLRVVEDHCRFTLADSHLAQRCKDLRHELAACLQDSEFETVVSMRDSDGDVGRTSTTPREYERTTIDAVLKANFARVQQATRSLEEYSKLANVEVAQRFEQIRYSVYQLEISLMATRTGTDRLARSAIYVLADATESDTQFRKRIKSLAQPREGGQPIADIVQLRDKQASTQVLLDRCRSFREVVNTQAGNASTLLIVNDRPDIANVARADGVHLGQDDMTIHEARTIVGPDMLVGVSTHNIEQAKLAVDGGANYIGVGPTFASTTKRFAALLGIDLVKAVIETVSLPAFAIGGINEDNVGVVNNAGIQRVAVSAAIWHAADPAAAAVRLRNSLTRLPLTSNRTMITGDNE